MFPLFHLTMILLSSRKNEAIKLISYYSPKYKIDIILPSEISDGNMISLVGCILVEPVPSISFFPPFSKGVNSKIIRFALLGANSVPSGVDLASAEILFQGRKLTIQKKYRQCKTQGCIQLA